MSANWDDIEFFLLLWFCCSPLFNYKRAIMPIVELIDTSNEAHATFFWSYSKYVIQLIRPSIIYTTILFYLIHFFEFFSSSFCLLILFVNLVRIYWKKTWSYFILTFAILKSLRLRNRLFCPWDERDFLSRILLVKLLRYFYFHIKILFEFWIPCYRGSNPNFNFILKH